MELRVLLCLGVKVSLAKIKVIVWLRFMRSVSFQLGVSMPVALIGWWTSM